MRFDYIKKFLVLAFAALCVSIVSVQSLRAQDQAGGGGGMGASELALLQKIADNTYGILEQVSGLQDVITALGLLATAWITPDKSDATATLLVPNFQTLDSMLADNLTSQIGMQAQLNKYMLPSSQLKNNPNVPVINQNNVPYANDLVYSTILGQPYWSKDPRDRGMNKVDTALNYILNASGMNITHVIPGLNWQGQQADQDRYQNYYNAVMAVESFNAFVLSQQYVNKNDFNDLQIKLLQSAGDTSNWMAKVATENIGWVLRQLLLYQSQSFVLMTQMVQSQKQMATAAVMTNALIITLNQQWETSFVSKAQGITPQG